MGNAIIARLGIDGRGVNTGLQNAQKEIDAFRQRNSTGAGAGGGKGHGGSGYATRAAGDVIDLVKGSKGAVMELNALEHALGFSLGAGVGIIAAVAAVEKLHEAFVNLKEANDQARASFAQTNASLVAAGPEAVVAQMEAAQKSIDKMVEARSTLAILAHGFADSGKIGLNAVGIDQPDRKNEAMESFRLELRQQERIRDLRVEARGHIKDETSDREKAVNAGERETELYKIRAQTAEKVAKINADKKYDGTGLRKSLIEGVKSEGAEAERNVNDKFDAKARELALERQISALKMAYQNPEQLIAKARIEAANAELAAARSPEAKDAAKTKLAAAQAELKAADRAKGEKVKGEKIARDKQQDSEENAAARRSLERAAKDREELRTRHIEDARKSDDRDTEAFRQGAAAVKSTQNRIREGAQVSLGDLATQGHGAVRREARQAQREETLARRRALHGDLAGAEAHTAKAFQIKNGIGTLKDADKLNSAAQLQGAIDKSAVLGSIKDATEKFVIKMR